MSLKFTQQTSKNITTFRYIDNINADFLIKNPDKKINIKKINKIIE